jgi:hypothetical protein
VPSIESSSELDSDSGAPGTNVLIKDLGISVIIFPTALEMCARIELEPESDSQSSLVELTSPLRKSGINVNPDGGSQKRAALLLSSKSSSSISLSQSL